MLTAHRRAWAVGALAALVATTAGLAAEAGPAAVLTAMKGKVKLVRAGKEAAIQLPCRLMVADQLKLAHGAQAVVIFPDQPSRRIEAKGAAVTWQVPAPGEVAAHESVMSALWRWILARLKPGERSARTVAPISRGDEGQPVGYWPRDTLVSQSLPNFAWRELPKATYQLIVMDRLGHELWTSDEVAEPRVKYAEDGPPLLPGVKYWWEVRAFTEDDIESSGLCWIQIATAEQRKALEDGLHSLSAEVGPVDETASAADKAFLLASQGFNGEALEILCGLSGAVPTDDLVKAWLDFLTPPASE